MDWSGKVIEVNATYLEQFQGGNYGVPVDFGKRLPSGGGAAPHEARTESHELLARHESDKEKNITSCTTKSKLP